MKRRVTFSLSNKKINLSELIELTEFCELWILPESEVTRRTNIIKDAITEYSSLSPRFDNFFKLKGTLTTLQIVFILAHLKPVSDEMLMDCVEGIGESMFYLLTQNEKHAEQCQSLLLPSFNMLKELLGTDIWRTLIINEEITGEEYQVINGMHIPFTVKAIKKHIDRMSTFPITVNDIAIILDDYRRYNQKLYGHKDKNSILEQLKNEREFEYDVLLIKTIYQKCFQFDIIDVTLIHFFVAVSLADFSQITFSAKYKGQHLVYKLSKILGQRWYSVAVEKMSWTKPECSSHGTRLIKDKWFKALNRVIPNDD